MTDNKSTTTNELSFDERKKALIAQGASRRREADRSIDIVRTNLHVEPLVKSAVAHLTTAATNKVEHMFYRRGITARNLGGNFKRYLPLAATAYAIIKRRKLLKPLLKGTGVLAALSGGAYMLWQRKKRAEAIEDATSEYLD